MSGVSSWAKPGATAMMKGRSQKPSKSGEGWAGFTWDNDKVVPNVFASC